MSKIVAKNHEDLVSFYSGNGADRSSIFEVWEDGGSRGDSVTPSTYSPEYRDWMADLLIGELEHNGGGLLSLGCGNAAVEAQVARKGFRVLAVDAMEEAVALARKKGLEAVCADIYQWQPDEPWNVIYIDGVLGHLYSAEDGLLPVLARVRSWLEPRPESDPDRHAASLVASNDAPNNGESVQKAPGVNGFHWLSAAYLREQAIEAGFDRAETREFSYNRPVSGPRTRAVMTGYLGR
ncbi:class I SAM-dependent methyltransferase [Actinacidiphila yeochonensis]|uniref:class I SAM-dependent methyltransferase n=1 Tax=Actinacidiphila yeochonensis TaxID=89050 RepID=UPI000567C281|nr:class I SAM-dependent methyltransferase [Actinacidiphila yeochonensis]